MTHSVSVGILLGIIRSAKLQEKKRDILLSSGISFFSLFRHICFLSLLILSFLLDSVKRYGYLATISFIFGMKRDSSFLHRDLTAQTTTARGTVREIVLVDLDTRQTVSM
jgi:hypothetical protein